MSSVTLSVKHFPKSDRRALVEGVEQGYCTFKVRQEGDEFAVVSMLQDDDVPSLRANEYRVRASDIVGLEKALQARNTRS